MKAKTILFMLLFIALVIAVYTAFIFLGVWLINTNSENLLVVFISMLLITLVINLAYAPIRNKILHKEFRKVEVQQKEEKIKVENKSGLTLTSLKQDIKIELIFLPIYLAYGFVYWQVESFLGNTNNSWKYAISFSLSIPTTYLIVRLLSLFNEKILNFALNLSWKINILRLERIFMVDDAPVESYNLIKILYSHLLLYLLYPTVFCSPLILLLASVIISAIRSKYSFLL